MSKPSLPKGFAGSYDDALGQSLNLNDLLVTRPASTYFVRVNGENMASNGVNSGDILVVDRSLTAAHDDLVIAVYEGEMLLRTLQIKEPGSACLVGDIDAPIELVDDDETLIWGVVTASMRQFRKSL